MPINTNVAATTIQNKNSFSFAFNLGFLASSITIPCHSWSGISAVTGTGTGSSRPVKLNKVVPPKTQSTLTMTTVVTESIAVRVFLLNQLRLLQE